MCFFFFSIFDGSCEYTKHTFIRIHYIVRADKAQWPVPLQGSSSGRYSGSAAARDRPDVAHNVSARAPGDVCGTCAARRRKKPAEKEREGEKNRQRKKERQKKPAKKEGEGEKLKKNYGRVGGGRDHNKRGGGPCVRIIHTHAAQTVN